MEALQLKEFGWTQQQIADALEIPLQTVNRWLINVGMGKRSKVGNDDAISPID